MTASSLWSKAKVAFIAVLIGASIVGEGMLVWHYMHVQFLSDEADVQDTIASFNARVAMDTARINALNSSLASARSVAAGAVPATAGCKFTPELAGDITKAFSGK